MPDTKYQVDTQRYECLGLDLNRPVDSVKPGKFPVLFNVRAFQAGRVEPRDGLSDTGVLDGPVHSCRRLNDPNTGGWTRIIGNGGELAGGQGPYAFLDSGYSGDPLALVPWRTDASPTGFMYVADRLRMRKTCIAGELHTIGLPPPPGPPFATVDKPLYRTVDPNFLGTAWTPGGTNAPGGVKNFDRFSRNNTPAPPPVVPSVTITEILYDVSIGPGWASMVLTSPGPPSPSSNDPSYGKGEILNLNPAGLNQEYVVVHEVFKGDTTQTVAIGGIVYDNIIGPGACSIQLAAPLQFLVQNCLLLNNTRGRYFRAIAVTGGPDQTVSIRTITTGPNYAPGDSISVVPSLRVYIVNNSHTFPGTETVTSPTVGATFIKGTGSLTLTLGSTVDLTRLSTTSILPSSGGTIPVANDDFMHVGIIVDHPELITEIQAQLILPDAPSVVAPATDQNYYYRAFRSPDLTPNVINQQPILTTSGTIIQNQQLQNPQQPQVTSQPMNSPGNDQWADLTFRMSDLIKVGNDQTRNLQNVAKLRFVVTATASVVILFNSWWVGGGYNPDTFDATAIPYKYRYRARVSTTGVTSNWSPAMIDQVDPERMQVEVTLNQYPAPFGTSMTTSDFVLDVQRYGGELAQWHYAGTVENTATPVFTDNYPDDTVAVLPAEEQDSWQPWPIVGLPVSGGGAVQIAGINVYDPTPNAFDIRWAPGTVIKFSGPSMPVGGTPFTIYRVVNANFLQLVESANTAVNVSWRIDDPTIMAQNLPCLWGDEQLGAMFACGDPMNPGRLYFSNGNNPDATQENNYVDITSTSEPLMNGVVYNLRSYVFSSERMFQILPTGNPDDPWHAQEIPNGKGLFSRWAITRMPAPIICFLSKDGINATTGGAPQALTDADLYEFFPNEGNLGSNINGFRPPNITAAQATNLRLDYYDEYLYFDFIDVPPGPGSGTRATLVLAFDLGAMVRGDAPGGWFYDFYAPGVIFHYGEEGAGVHSLLCGAEDNHLYQYTLNTSDAGQPFLCSVRTGSRDQGDVRSLKLYGDVMLDADTKGVDITATVEYDNAQRVSTPFVVNTGTNGRQQTAIPLGTQWQEGRNIALSTSWVITGAARPLLYIWEPRYTFSSTPISTSSAPGQASAGWSMSPSSLGLENWKHINLVRIAFKATSPVQLNLVYDGVAAPVITIPASGGALTQTIFHIPVQKFKLLQASINGTGGDFSLDTRDTYFDIKEWGSDGEYRGFRLFGDFSMVEG